METTGADEILERSIRSLVEARVPGLSITVVSPDGVKWARAIGLSDIATQTPMSSGTTCNWFSMTKIATATATMQLVDRGALGLDDPVAQHFPGFKAMQPERWANAATVRHLLSHSSGIANPPPLKWVRLADQPPPDQERFIHDLLSKHNKLKFEPGSKASYTNIGFLVLGQIIASASGQSYEDYIRGHVLKPLGMTRTDFLDTEKMGRPATAYQRRASVTTPILKMMVPRGLFGVPIDGYIPFKRFYVNGAAYGGLVGPSEDAARLVRAHLCGGELEGVRILSPESTALMQQIRVIGRRFDLGLAWFRPHKAATRPRAFVEHLGDGGGFANDMRIYPDASLGIVMMGNSGSYDRDGVAELIAERWWNDAG